MALNKCKRFIVICWQCKISGGITIEDYQDEDDIIDLVGICPNCLAPGIVDYLCNKGHVHTAPFESDIESYEGLKDLEFIFDTMEKLLSDSSLTKSAKRKLSDVIKEKNVELKKLMVQYVN